MSRGLRGLLDCYIPNSSKRTGSHTGHIPQNFNSLSRKSIEFIVVQNIFECLEVEDVVKMIRWWGGGGGGEC